MNHQYSHQPLRDIGHFLPNSLPHTPTALVQPAIHSSWTTEQQPKMIFLYSFLLPINPSLHKSQVELLQSKCTHDHSMINPSQPPHHQQNQFQTPSQAAWCQELPPPASTSLHLHLCLTCTNPRALQTHPVNGTHVPCLYCLCG